MIDDDYVCEYCGECITDPSGCQCEDNDD